MLCSKLLTLHYQILDKYIFYFHSSKTATMKAYTLTLHSDCQNRDNKLGIYSIFYWIVESTHCFGYIHLRIILCSGLVVFIYQWLIKLTYFIWDSIDMKNIDFYSCIFIFAHIYSYCTELSIEHIAALVWFPRLSQPLINNSTYQN